MLIDNYATKYARKSNNAVHLLNVVHASQRELLGVIFSSEGKRVDPAKITIID
jgi:hypothetical protein